MTILLTVPAMLGIYLFRPRMETVICILTCLFFWAWFVLKIVEHIG